MYCIQCGASISDDWNACPQCGASLTKNQYATGPQGFSHQPANILTTSERPTGLRFLAGFIDIILMSILFTVMAFAIGDTETSGGGFTVQLNGWPALLYFFIVMAYYIVMEGLTGATIGKLIVGLKVVKLNGEHYGWGASMGRNLLRIIDGLPFLYLIGIISIAVTGNKQRVGDLAVNTVVVRR